jgi:transcriptional regulator with XRE-family HTH domain
LTKSLHSTRYCQFRKRLTEARINAGISQADLAERLGKPQSFVSKFERGERRLDIIEFLDVAAILGLGPAAFLTDLQRANKQ